AVVALWSRETIGDAGHQIDAWLNRVRGIKLLINACLIPQGFEHGGTELVGWSGCFCVGDSVKGDHAMSGQHRSKIGIKRRWCGLWFWGCERVLRCSLLMHFQRLGQERIKYHKEYTCKQHAGDEYRRNQRKAPLSPASFA